MAIPEKGSTIKREKVIATHPEYEIKTKHYQLYRECYEATGGFAPTIQRNTRGADSIDDVTHADDESTWLKQHTGEDASDFRDRCSMAMLPNFVKHRVISPISGFLTQDGPMREGFPGELEKWLETATLDDQDFDTWKGDEGVPYGLIYGGLPIILDSDPGEFENEAERLDAGAQFAKIRVVHPESILDWQRDRSGRLTAIKYRAILDVWDPIEGHAEVIRYYWILPEGYFWIDEFPDQGSPSELVVAHSGIWPWAQSLGPMAPIAEVAFLKNISLIQDVAPMVIRLFNALSELTELQRKYAFSILFVPGGQKEDARKVGTGRFWGLPEEIRQMPKYVTPDKGPFDHYMAFLAWLIQLIQELGGTAAFFGAGAEAAATMAYRFQATQRFLQRLAKSLVRFEKQVAKIVMAWHGKELPENLIIRYSQTFDAVDIERFLAWMTAAVQDIGLPPTARALVQKRVIDRILPDCTPDEEEQIDEELETEKQVEARMAADPGQMARTAQEPVAPPRGVEVPGSGRKGT